LLAWGGLKVLSLVAEHTLGLIDMDGNDSAENGILGLGKRDSVDYFDDSRCLICHFSLGRNGVTHIRPGLADQLR
jgi:hypothetical protein